MPRVVVVLDIDAYAKDPRKIPYKGLIEKGDMELGGSCPQCGKDFLDDGEVVFGKATLADGSDWLNSGKSFFDGGSFNYETQSIEWLFENCHLWNREDTIAVCSRECAEARELKFRQIQAEIEIKNNPLEQCFPSESVVFHGTETPRSEAPAIPPSPTESTLPRPGSPAPPPPSPAPSHTTPTTKRGRAPPPPPPRSPSVTSELETKAVVEDTNPFSPSNNAHFASSSSSSSSDENPFADNLVSPKTIHITEPSEVKVEITPREQSVVWCLEELARVQIILVEATRRVAELSAALEVLRRDVHPPPPLPPLPEDDNVKQPEPTPSFTAPVVASDADDVN